MKEISWPKDCHFCYCETLQFWNLKIKMRIFGIQMGMSQLLVILIHVLQHISGDVAQKSGVSVWEIVGALSAFIHFNWAVVRPKYLFFSKITCNWLPERSENKKVYILWPDAVSYLCSLVILIAVNLFVCYNNVKKFIFLVLLIMDID